MKGSTVSYDGGKFYLAVTHVSITDNEIKFTPYIKVTDAFKKKHTAEIRWKKENDKTTEKHTKSNVKSKGTYYSTSKKYSNKDEKVEIVAEIGGKKSSVTIEATKKPLQPKLTVKRTNDYHYNITIERDGKPTIPTTSVILERQTDANSASWEELKTFTGTTYGYYKHEYIDQGVERGHRYKYRVRAHNVNGYSSYKTLGWFYTLPPDVSDVNHVRISNSTNRVTWSKSGQELDRSLITGYVLLRSTNGGIYEAVPTRGNGTRVQYETADGRIITVSAIDPGAKEDGTVTYDDTGCTVDNYYRYAVKPVNEQGISVISYPSDGGTEATYNTPGAPVKVVATALGDGTVKVELDNRTHTGDVLQIAKCQDGVWTQFEDIDESEGPVTEYIDESSTTGTIVKYRARNGREDLAPAERYSEWTESNELSTLSKPNPPSLVRPVNNTAITLDHETCSLHWIHNATDGTAQTTAEIVVSRNGIESTYTVTTDPYYDLDISSYSPIDEITWKVRTKGEDDEWSDYSESYTFTCYDLPELHVTSPQNGSVIENLPLEITYTYSNLSGNLEKLTLDIVQDDETVYSKDITPEPGASYTYTIDDFLFDNESSYSLRLTSLSDIGLQAVDEVGIDIEYVPVLLQNQYYVDTVTDSDTGYVTVMITGGEYVPDEDPDPDIPQPVIVNSPVARAFLYRIYDGKKTLISEVYENEQLTDKYAPLNAEFTYELLEIAVNGNIAIVDQECEIDSDYWYVYYGTSNEKIARARWNPSGDVSLARPEKQQVMYSGREYPVTYDSGANEEKYSFSTTLTDRDELNNFREMMKKGGQGVWKSADGFVYPADFEFTFSADYTDVETSWSAKLEVTRIEGDL